MMMHSLNDDNIPNYIFVPLENDISSSSSIECQGEEKHIGNTLLSVSSTTVGASKEMPHIPQRRANGNTTAGIADILLETAGVLFNAADLFSLGESEVNEEKDCQPGGCIPILPRRQPSIDGFSWGNNSNSEVDKRDYFCEIYQSKRDSFVSGGSKDDRPPRVPQRKYLSQDTKQPLLAKIWGKPRALPSPFGFGLTQNISIGSSSIKTWPRKNRTKMTATSA